MIGHCIIGSEVPEIFLFGTKFLPYLNKRPSERDQGVFCYLRGRCSYTASTNESLTCILQESTLVGSFP